MKRKINKELLAQQSRIMKVVSYVDALLVLIIFLITYFIFDEREYLPYIMLPTAVGIIINILLYEKHGDLYLTFKIFMILSYVVVTAIICLTGGILSPFLFVFVVFCIGAFMSSKKLGTYVVAFMFLSALTIYLLQQSGILNINIIEDQHQAHFALAIFVFVLTLSSLLSLLLTRASFNIYRAKKEVDEKNKIIEEKNIMLEKLSLVAEKTDNYVIIIGKDDLIEWVNEGFTRLTGYTFDEAVGKVPSAVLGGPLMTEEVIKKIDEDVLKHHKTHSGEIANYHKNGEVFWASIHITPILDKNGELHKYFAIGSDITEKREAEKQIVEQRDQLAKKNQQIADSISYAEMIQMAMLPPLDSIKKQFPQSFILLKPKDIVSGDFYWYTEATRDGNPISIIAAVDCTGHGVPGAFMSMIGNTLLNEIVNQNEMYDAAEILMQLDDGVIKSLNQDDESKKSQDDGMDISICVIDNVNNNIQFAAANHSMYLIQNSKLEKIKGNIFSIGGMYKKERRNFSNHDIEISPGLSIYLFSDGYKDQFGGENKSKFLATRLEDLLLKIQNSDMQEQKEKLIAAFDDWKGEGDQIDDVLMIGIRF